MTNRTQRRLLVAALALAITQVAAQDPFRLKPGATGKVCMGCHVTFEETMSRSSVHTPVKSGDCSGCHNPHASSHGMLLAEETDRICTQCHEEILPDAARSAHATVASGECVACHDPHATDHANNLVRGGNELCAGCHEDLARAIADVRFKHRPVEEGCLTCHGPHASAETGFLLREDVPGLCVNCHDVTRASFSEQHMGYPVAGARCTSCHDPHGSDRAGMLWSTVHRPIVSKMCKQCHPDPSAPDALQAKAAGAELCRGCHSKMVNEAMASERIHWPLVDRVACRHCHNPHASKHDALLSDPTAEVCGQCHQDTIARQERAGSQHQPVLDGDCTVCHSPHASDGEFMLASEGTIDLCGTCHDWQSHSTHPIGEEIIDQRNANLSLDCTSCHFAHGSDHKFIAPMDPAGELCVSCHEQYGR